MAIRPVDLQLSYTAAPQNAATLAGAQEAPAAAQQAAAASFAAQVAQREEHVAELSAGEHLEIRRREQPPGGNGGESRRRKRAQPQPPAPQEENPLGLAGDGEHFIDVTA